MKKENLFDFIETGSFPDGFYTALREEVIEYKNAVCAQKGVKNIYGDGDSEVPFGRGKLIALLGHYLDGKIFEWDLEYILNYIDMSFENTDEKVEEVVFSLSDPYLNFPIIAENVKVAISYLEGKVDSMRLEAGKRKSLREGYRSVFSDILA